MGEAITSLPLGQQISLPGHFDKATGIALARANVDFTGFQRTNVETEERRLLPRYVETLFLKSCEEVGLKVEPRADGLWRIEVKGRQRGQSIRLITNEWYKAVQLGDSYWLYVVWDPLGKPDAEPLRIQNPAKHFDHAKKEVLAARYFDIPAIAVEQAAQKGYKTV